MRGHSRFLVRLATGLVLPVFLLGCGSPALLGEPVALATVPGGVENGGDVGCLLFDNRGLLIAHPQTGTAAQGVFGVRPLIWPPGYTGRRLATGAVAVLDGTGVVVATTGRTYQFWTQNWSGGQGPVQTGGPGCVNELRPED